MRRGVHTWILAKLVLVVLVVVGLALVPVPLAASAAAADSRIDVDVDYTCGETGNVAEVKLSSPGGTVSYRQLFSSTALTLPALVNGSPVYPDVVEPQDPIDSEFLVSGARVTLHPLYSYVFIQFVDTNVGGVQQSSDVMETIWFTGCEGARASIFDAYKDIQYTPSNNGYWQLKSSGQVETHGAAAHGSGPLHPEADSYQAIIPSSSDDGYWLATAEGRVAAVGDADDVVDLFELLGPNGLQGPIAGATGTPSGKGFWLVGSDGGIFALGDAEFYGSIPDLQQPGGPLEGQELAAPITGIASSPTGKGYWMVAGDGGMFAFGDAGFYGSVPGVLAPGEQLDAGIAEMIPQGNGYLLVGGDGGIFTFGESRFHGSLGGQGYIDVVSATVKADRSGYLIMRSNGEVFGFGSSTPL